MRAFEFETNMHPAPQPELRLVIGESQKNIDGIIDSEPQVVESVGVNWAAMVEMGKQMRQERIQRLGKSVIENEIE